MIATTAKIMYETGEKISIAPIFDVHMGNAACDVNGFRRYLRDNSDESTYFICGGDLTDSVITSDLKRYAKNIDATVGNEIIDEQIHSMVGTLEPYAPRILGSLTGNHEQNISKRCGTHPTKRLCSELGIPYWGYSCLLGLSLVNKSNPKKCISINFRLHHGWGGGSRTRGADITKYERDMGKWDADVFMYGHGHKSQVDKFPRLGRMGNKVTAKPKMLVLCGTFLKTFTDDVDPTYSEISGYPPTDIGCPRIIITPTEGNGYKLNAWI